MNIITERDMIKAALQHWEVQCGRGAGEDAQKAKKLRELDPDTCSAQDLTDILGDWSWGLVECDECWKKTNWAISLGEGSGQVAVLCRSCFGKAVSLAQPTPGTPSDAPTA